MTVIEGRLAGAQAAEDLAGLRGVEGQVHGSERDDLVRRDGAAGADRQIDARRDDEAPGRILPFDVISEPGERVADGGELLRGVDHHHVRAPGERGGEALVEIVGGGDVPALHRRGRARGGGDLPGERGLAPARQRDEPHDARARLEAARQKTPSRKVGSAISHADTLSSTGDRLVTAR